MSEELNEQHIIDAIRGPLGEIVYETLLDIYVWADNIIGKKIDGALLKEISTNQKEYILMSLTRTVLMTSIGMFIENHVKDEFIEDFAKDMFKDLVINLRAVKNAKETN